MDTTDEIAVEDHRYFQARLAHLERQHPAALLAHLEQGTLTQHLREIAERGMQAKAKLVFERNMTPGQADELVMNQVVADPAERSRLRDPEGRMKLRRLLDRYKAEMPNLPRTYQSQNETTE
ncbi:MAG TPA: hypothetical protein DCX07_08770 [Phycisphaerales bacterium]|nr:hypothetical protein [Phycisphaerales bacterium]